MPSKRKVTKSSGVKGDKKQKIDSIVDNMEVKDELQDIIDTEMKEDIKENIDTEMKDGINENQDLKINTFSLTGPYAQDNNNVRLHETIMGAKAPSGQVIDHINGNKLDNTRENLRFATRNENSANRPKRANTSSKYKGLTYKGPEKWPCKANWNNRYRSIGTFKTEIEGARQYDKFILASRKSIIATNTKLYPNEIILTPEEIELALNSDPEDYFFKRKFDLPKNISMVNNKYVLGMKHETGDFISKRFVILDDAVKERDEIIHRVEQAEWKAITDQPIVRNEQGVAVIFTNETKGESHELTVGNDDYYFLKQFSWTASWSGDFKNALDIHASVNRVRMKLHYLVWNIHHPSDTIPDGLTIDHIDGDHRNVRISNLRLLTPAEQSHNRKSMNALGSKGIYPNGARFDATIGFEGKNIHLGTFNTKIEAEAAYFEASEEYYPGVLQVIR